MVPHETKPVTLENDMKKTLILGVATLALLAGCAGREAHPVAMIQPQDTSESCQSIAAEISANNAQASSLASQASTHNATNALVVGVGALLFWPALFALDLSDYERQEIAALQARDMHLQEMSAQHACPAA
jgi:hypothetical protein